MDTITLPFKTFLREELPDCFQESLQMAIKGAYQAAYESGKNTDCDGWQLLAPLEKERLSDAQGLHVQSAMYRWAVESGLDAHFGANSRKRAHVQIKSSRSLLTSHRVLDPKNFPRYAKYRHTNALANRQLFLPLALQKKSKFDDHVYVYIVHGPSIDDNSRLGFLQLAAPSPVSQTYLATHTIFMEDQFDSAGNIEEIEDKATITLRNVALKRRIVTS